MQRAPATELRRRWTDGRIADLQRQIPTQSRIVKGPHRIRTEWAETDDGLLDLRGLAVGRDGMQFRYLTLARVDFGHARGRLSFFESELSDCRFDAATLSGQPRFDRRFERCSFRDAALKSFSIGTRVVECDFTGADARKLRSLPNTRFERCVFDTADLSGADFADTAFVGCTFAGARFSATTSFTRCAFTDTAVEFGLARVTRSTRQGESLPDRWDGEGEGSAAFDAYLERYIAAAEAGCAEDLPLEPDEPLDQRRAGGSGSMS